MGPQLYLCKVTAYMDKHGNIQWRDYFGNVWPIVIPEARDGDVVEVYVERTA